MNLIAYDCGVQKGFILCRQTSCQPGSCSGRPECSMCDQRVLHTSTGKLRRELTSLEYLVKSNNISNSCRRGAFRLPLRSFRHVMQGAQVTEAKLEAVKLHRFASAAREALFMQRYEADVRTRTQRRTELRHRWSNTAAFQMLS